MLTFSEDLEDVRVQQSSLPEDSGFLAAVLTFSSLAGAQEVQNKLHGKPNLSRTAELIVELPAVSPASATSNGKGFPSDAQVSIAPRASTSSTSSSTSSLRQGQTPRYNGSSQTVDQLAMSMSSLSGLNGMGAMNGVNSMASSMTNSMNGMYGADLSSSAEISNNYSQHMFSSQSPIGNHLRPGISGKALIKNDMADDDEANQLLSDLGPPRDPVLGGFTENNNSGPQSRRSTVPHIPINRMGPLSLATNMNVPASMPTAYGHPSASPFSALARAQAADNSPVMMNGAASAHPYNMNPHHRGGSSFPAVNPADQNPPCNTLYVGNLPADTSEEELKTLFSKQRGYKRLCFRTKGNGPMCFVEFEDVSFATKALNDLYGMPLHNSTKGGIRLSFSKNPLGVRSNQNPTQGTLGSGVGANGLGPGSANGFAAANGPPPGLRVPPGFRQAYTAPSQGAAGPSNLYSGNNAIWNNGYNATAQNANLHNSSGFGAGANGFSPNGYNNNGYSSSNGHGHNGHMQSMYPGLGDDLNEDYLQEDDTNRFDHSVYRSSNGLAAFASGYPPR